MTKRVISVRGKGFVGEDLGVLGNPGIGFGFEVVEGLAELALVCGGFAFFEQAFVEAGVFFVVGVFGAEELVAALEVLGAGMDVLELGDVVGHLVLGDFREVSLLEQALQFLLEGEEFGVSRVEVAAESFAGAAELVAEFVGDDQFLLGNLAEGEEHVLQGDVEEVDAFIGALDGIALVEQCHVVGGLVGERAEFAEVELVEQLVLAGEADEVVEVFGVLQGLDDAAHLGLVFDLADLLGEDLGVLGVVVEECVLDGLDVGSDLVCGLEEVGVAGEFVAEFGLEFVEVVFVGFIELLLNIHEINDIAVAVIAVGAVDAGKGLQEVVGLDDAAKVELF